MEVGLEKLISERPSISSFRFLPPSPPNVRQRAARTRNLFLQTFLLRPLHSAQMSSCSVSGSCMKKCAPTPASHCEGLRCARCVVLLQYSREAGQASPHLRHSFFRSWSSAKASAAARRCLRRTAPAPKPLIKSSHYPLLQGQIPN